MNSKVKDPFFEATIGPYFLNCALCSLVLYVAHFLWPLLLVAAVGSILTWHWRKRGFYAALTILCSTVIWKYSFFAEHSWSFVFLASIGLSWGILLMGRSQVVHWMLSVGQLEKELEKVKALSSQVMEERDRERQQREEWCLECEKITSELISYQLKEKSLQNALQDAQHEAYVLQKCQMESVNVVTDQIIPQENLGELSEEMLRDRAKINAAFSAERDVLDAATDDEGIVFSIPKETGAADGVSQPAESVAVIFAKSLSDLRQMQARYELLKEQFHEKSDLLHQTRQQLFSTETQLIALQKTQEESVAEPSVEADAFCACLDQMEEECREAELQIHVLEEIIAEVIVPKKVVHPRKPKGIKEDQGFLPMMLYS